MTESDTTGTCAEAVVEGMVEVMPVMAAAEATLGTIGVRQHRQDLEVRRHLQLRLHTLAARGEVMDRQPRAAAAVAVTATGRATASRAHRMGVAALPLHHPPEEVALMAEVRTAALVGVATGDKHAIPAPSPGWPPSVHSTSWMVIPIALGTCWRV